MISPLSYNPFEHPSHASKNPGGLGAGPQGSGDAPEYRKNATLNSNGDCLKVIDTFR